MASPFESTLYIHGTIFHVQQHAMGPENNKTGTGVGRVAIVSESFVDEGAAFPAQSISMYVRNPEAARTIAAMFTGLADAMQRALDEDASKKAAVAMNNSTAH